MVTIIFLIKTKMRSFKTPKSLIVFHPYTVSITACKKIIKHNFCKLFCCPGPNFVFLCRVQQPHEPSYENNFWTNITWREGRLSLGVPLSEPPLGGNRGSGWGFEAECGYNFLSSFFSNTILHKLVWNRTRKRDGKEGWNM